MPWPATADGDPSRTTGSRDIRAAVSPTAARPPVVAAAARRRRRGRRDRRRRLGRAPAHGRAATGPGDTVHDRPVSPGPSTSPTASGTVATRPRRRRAPQCRPRPSPCRSTTWRRPGRPTAATPWSGCSSRVSCPRAPRPRRRPTPPSRRPRRCPPATRPVRRGLAGGHDRPLRGPPGPGGRRRRSAAPASTGLPDDAQRLAVQALVWTVTAAVQQASAPVAGDRRQRRADLRVDAAPTSSSGPRDDRAFTEVAAHLGRQPVCGPGARRRPAGGRDRPGVRLRGQRHLGAAQGGSVVRQGQHHGRRPGCPQQGRGPSTSARSPPVSYEFRAIDVSAKDGSVTFQKIVPFSVG